MKPVSFILILVLAVFAAGCSGSKYYQSGVAPTNMSTIQAGTSRQMIEELLGEPVESEPDGDRQVDTYEYNMGRTADVSKADPMFLAGDGAAALLGAFWNCFGRVICRLPPSPILKSRGAG